MPACRRTLAALLLATQAVPMATAATPAICAYVAKDSTHGFTRLAEPGSEGSGTLRFDALDFDGDGRPDIAEFVLGSRGFPQSDPAELTVDLSRGGQVKLVARWLFVAREAARVYVFTSDTVCRNHRLDEMRRAWVVRDGAWASVCGTTWRHTTLVDEDDCPPAAAKP